MAPSSPSPSRSSQIPSSKGDHSSNETRSYDAIDAGDSNDVEDDEFTLIQLDSTSIRGGSFGSLTPSVFHHVSENGRKFYIHKHGTYPLPLDEDYQSTEEMAHVVFKEMTQGRLFLSPIGDHPQRIIDLGTGTGAWAADVADKYASAQVVGIDQSPIQQWWVPPNLEFFHGDVAEWDSHWGSGFDLVHLRFMLTTMTSQCLEQVVQGSLANIRPSGWIEIQEACLLCKCDDDSMQADSAKKVLDTSEEVLLREGRIFRENIYQMGEMLEKAGFLNVTCRKFKIPIGWWPKNKKMRLVGYLMANVLGGFFDVVAAKILPTVLESDRVTELLDAAKKELVDPTSHAYVEAFFWYAQKPQSA